MGAGGGFAARAPCLGAAAGEVSGPVDIADHRRQLRRLGVARVGGCVCVSICVCFCVFEVFWGRSIRKRIGAGEDVSCCGGEKERLRF